MQYVQNGMRQQKRKQEVTERTYSFREKQRYVFVSRVHPVRATISHYTRARVTEEVTERTYSFRDKHITQTENNIHNQKVTYTNI